MTHVLHLSTWHPVIDDVAGLFVLEQCAALRALEIKTGLIFSRIQGARGLTVGRVARGIPGFVRFDAPVPTLGFKSWNVPGLAPFVPRVNEWMLRNRYAAYAHAFGKPDILHAHVALEGGSAARRIAAQAGIDYVVTEHSSEVLNGIATSARQKAAARIYREARYVLAVSEVLAERIAQICPAARIRVVGNLVRSSVFARRLTGRILGDRIKIVSICSLSPNKRMHIAIQALLELPETMRVRIDHHIVGEGPERAALEEQSRKGGLHTIFHGNLPHDRVMAVLAEADLFLHPSAYETFGVVIAEAMALGVPVVATRCGGPEGIVEPETGLLVEVDDIDAMRDAVGRMLNNLAEWRMRGDAIARRAHDRFHENNIAMAIAETYR